MTQNIKLHHFLKIEKYNKAAFAFRNDWSNFLDINTSEEKGETLLSDHILYT